jgi:hypothetical protein
VYLTNARGVRVLDEVLSAASPNAFRPGSHQVTLDLPPVLNVGRYAVGVWIGTATTTVVDEPVVTTFELIGSDRGRWTALWSSTWRSGVPGEDRWCGFDPRGRQALGGSGRRRVWQVAQQADPSAWRSFGRCRTSGSRVVCIYRGRNAHLVRRMVGEVHRHTVRLCGP